MGFSSLQKNFQIQAPTQTQVIMTIISNYPQSV